ncbi:hypothetical protein MES4922_280006 [Mesorhizobium ventifaucium]|uniref:Uncharacterized protein n=1 Tax=Mesorhizobium ventifaucium TaxID=666020 RepID=A0ABN8JTV8_9HYPH|nr:hypothetical protein MES4922_280006 [Mesorhizobium ventifaucium]
MPPGAAPSTIFTIEQSACSHRIARLTQFRAELLVRHFVSHVDLVERRFATGAAAARAVDATAQSPLRSRAERGAFELNWESRAIYLVSSAFLRRQAIRPGCKCSHLQL